MAQLRKKYVGPMVHDADFRPIRGRENLSAPPMLESRPHFRCARKCFLTQNPNFEAP